MKVNMDAVERIRDMVYAETHPDRMDKREALAVLEEVIADIDGMILALREEIDGETKEPK